MCPCAGQKRAREMWFLARMYDARQALQMGLVNTVVPLDQLECETLVWYVYPLTHCVSIDTLLCYGGLQE